MSPAKLALLKLSLSLRAHSPAVETFQQVRRRKFIKELAVDIFFRTVIEVTLLVARHLDPGLSKAGIM